MQCPHCLEHFNEEIKVIPFEPHEVRTNTVPRPVGGRKNQGEMWKVIYVRCAGCQNMIVFLTKYFEENFRVFPKMVSRLPLSKDVPDMFADDYKEACLVLVDSPKASAALSRRCLQNIIREHYKIKKGTLDGEITELLKLNTLPTDLAHDIDAIRVSGNFAAHPIKDIHTGEIIDVEPNEAEWMLNILEELFEHCFVAPAKREAKRVAMNAKSASAGKPALKTP